MKKMDFNQNWTYKRLGEEKECASVTLPHDAMRTENRSLLSKGEYNIGWYEGYDYEYHKRFSLQEGTPDKKVILEFEGVYHDAEVWLDGEKVAYRPYGYTNFYVDLSGRVHGGEEHELCVIARNADQPNSRWYSGSGIYRPVWLYVADDHYIPVEGITVRTVWTAENGCAGVETVIETSLAGPIQMRILDKGGNIIAEATEMADGFGSVKTTWNLQNITLWDVDHPVLYTLQVTFGDDVVEETFGIRTLTWTKENGIAINGKRVILRGACIHHDNGVLGACAFPEAEERKIRILKENGYNAIRSAHNPCSKALLDACDRLGMLVMDEYTDMWYIHKNKYDYATKMTDWWREDLKNMAGKDKNHPSVILYSTGNEVAETGQERGIRLTKEMTEYLHELDRTRPVTCGINIFFNALYSMGFGVYSDEKAEKESKKSDDPKKKKTVGSEFYNALVGLLGDKTMKLGATLPICDRKTKDAYAAMDIAGYNYGIDRYRHDLKAYPDRLILGSETFCGDAYSFYELAKRQPRIVGDFVWAGMDYIGEAGIGAWEYEDYAPKDADKSGWLTAGSGRINILGFPNAEAAYTKVAFEQEKGPRMAVKPVYQKGRHSPSAWKMTDAMESWSFDGCEDSTATVEVYARAAYVKVFLNKKIVGKAIYDGKCKHSFKVPYAPGTLTAISYRADGSEIGRCSLKSAKQETILRILPEEKSMQSGGLGFIRLQYTDPDGILKPMEKHRIKVSVEGGSLEGLGNACSYNPDGYDKKETNTYYGEALLVVRAGNDENIVIHVADERNQYKCSVPVDCRKDDRRDENK